MDADLLEILRTLDGEADRQGVPKELARAILGAENFKDGDIPKGGRIRTDLTSPKQAAGVMQVIPDTWRSLVKQGKISADADPNNPADNIKAGVAVIAERYKARNGNAAAIAADYNGGTAAGDAILRGQDPPSAETKDYLRKAKVTGNAPMATLHSSGTKTTNSGMDAGQMQEDFDRSSANMAGLTTMLEAATGERQGALKDIAETAPAVGEAMGEVARAKGEIEAAQITQARDIVQVLNGGHDPDSTLMREQVAIESARARQDALRSVIDSRDSITIFDDPLGWVMNRIELPGLKNQYNAAYMEEQVRTARQTSDQAKIRAQQQIDTPAIQQEVKARAAAEMSEYAAKAAIQAAQANAESSQVAISLINHKMDVEKWDYSQRVQMGRLLAEKTQWYAGEREANAKEQKIKDEILTPANIRRTAWGLPEIKPGMFAAMDQKSRNEVIQDALRPALGKSPGDALDWLIDSGAINTAAQAQPVVSRFMQTQLGTQAVRDMELKIRTDLGAKGAAMPEGKITSMAWDAVVKQQTNDLAKNKDRTNLPDNHWGKVQIGEALQYKELVGNPVVTMITEYSAANPGKLPTDKDIARSFVAKAAVDPSKSSEFAKAYSDFYRIAAEQQYKKAAAVLGFPQTREYVLDLLEGTHKVDAFSPAQVQAWMDYNIVKLKKDQAYFTAINPMASTITGMDPRLQGGLSFGARP